MRSSRATSHIATSSRSAPVSASRPRTLSGNLALGSRSPTCGRNSWMPSTGRPPSLRVARAQHHPSQELPVAVSSPAPIGVRSSSCITPPDVRTSYVAGSCPARRGRAGRSPAATPQRCTRRSSTRPYSPALPSFTSTSLVRVERISTSWIAPNGTPVPRMVRETRSTPGVVQRMIGRRLQHISQIVQKAPHPRQTGPG